MGVIALRRDRVRHVDARDLRVAGGLMLGAAAVWQTLPHGVGVPCLLRHFTGVPCPLCGMTTSVVATVHGHLGAAFSANPAGIVAVIVAVALLIAYRVRAIPMANAAMPIALAAMWLFELHRFRFI